MFAFVKIKPCIIIDCSFQYFILKIVIIGEAPKNKYMFRGVQHQKGCCLRVTSQSNYCCLVRKNKWVANLINELFIFLLENNNHFVYNMIRQHQFLSNVGKKLSSGIKDPLVDLDNLRTILTNPKNLMLRIAANLDTLPSQISNLTSPWKSLLPPNVTPIKQK